MRVKSKGTVYLVGAGPGDTGLLTLRGAELLRRADVVLYDALVNPGLLRLAPPSAELVARGKNRTMPQEKIMALLIARAREGKCVVRLKGGDPYIFGRGGEEAEALAAAKIPFEVVPGVSSVVAVPNYAGIPLTHRGRLNRSEQRPLFGQRIVVTRARAQAADFVRKLAELGADVLEIPVIKIAPADHKEDIVDALLGLHAYNWLVFTSANGVAAFFDLFFKRFKDLRDLGGARLAAVGPATAAKLRELHLEVDVMPDEAVGKRVAAAIAKFESIENLKICLLRAETANPDLPRALEELGAIVDDVAVYRTVPETGDAGEAGDRLRESGADWITFTSGSTVEHFHARFDLPNLVKRFPQTRLASTGPETSKAIRALGLEPALEAKEHTTDGLMAALLKAV